jgi:MFS family permease
MEWVDSGLRPYAHRPMLDSYRVILSRPGTALFSATGIVARMPISMLGVGIVLLVSQATGSYGVAGSVSGVQLVAAAVVAIPMGRLIDRLGQARVAVPAVTSFGLGLSLMCVSVQEDWPRATTYLFAVVAGLSLPPIGSCVRARWSHALAGEPRSLQTAFALEAVADEIVFMIGPILVTVLATTVHPVAGLGTAIALACLGTWFFAAQHATEPPVSPRSEVRSDRPRMPWRTVAPLTVVSLALGAQLGNAEVVTVAFSQEQGSRAYAGPLLAVWAFGSLLAGLASGAITWRRGPADRLRWGTALITLTMVPLTFVGSVPVMAAVLFVAGFAIAPTLIATMSLTEQRVPAARLTEGMAFVQTGIVAGVAPGAAIGGAVVDASGASTAYLVSLAAGLLGILAAQLLPRTRG